MKTFILHENVCTFDPDHGYYTYYSEYFQSDVNIWWVWELESLLGADYLEWLPEL